MDKQNSQFFSILLQKKPKVLHSKDETCYAILIHNVCLLTQIIFSQHVNVNVIFGSICLCYIKTVWSLQPKQLSLEDKWINYKAKQVGNWEKNGPNQLLFPCLSEDFYRDMKHVKKKYLDNLFVAFWSAEDFSDITFFFFLGFFFFSLLSLAAGDLVDFSSSMTTSSFADTSVAFLSDSSCFSNLSVRYWLLSEALK